MNINDVFKTIDERLTRIQSPIEFIADSFKLQRKIESSITLACTLALRKSPDFLSKKDQTALQHKIAQKLRELCPDNIDIQSRSHKLLMRIMQTPLERPLTQLQEETLPPLEPKSQTLLKERNISPYKSSKLSLKTACKILAVTLVLFSSACYYIKDTQSPLQTTALSYSNPSTPEALEADLEELTQNFTSLKLEPEQTLNTSGDYQSLPFCEITALIAPKTPSSPSLQNLSHDIFIEALVKTVGENCDKAKSIVKKITKAAQPKVVSKEQLFQSIITLERHYSHEALLSQEKLAYNMSICKKAIDTITPELRKKLIPLPTTSESVPPQCNDWLCNTFYTPVGKKVANIAHSIYNTLFNR